MRGATGLQYPRSHMRRVRVGSSTLRGREARFYLGDVLDPPIVGIVMGGCATHNTACTTETGHETKLACEATADGHFLVGDLRDRRTLRESDARDDA